MNGEYIRMSVGMNGREYSISEDLPALMKLSRGPMSRLGAMAGAIDRMSGRLAVMIDNEEWKAVQEIWLHRLGNLSLTG